MQTPVTVIADDNGMVIRQTKNPEYGFILLKQTSTTIQDNPANIKSAGWLKTTNETALIKGKIEELKALGFTDGMQLPGKIVVKESLTPFDSENPEQNIKIAGTSGVVCKRDGKPIYRVSYYTTEESEISEYVAHNNVAEIKGAPISKPFSTVLNNQDLESSFESEAKTVAEDINEEFTEDVQESVHNSVQEEDDSVEESDSIEDTFDEISEDLSIEDDEFTL